MSDLGFRVGSSRRVDCWAGVRDSTVVLGPPGSGKGVHLVIPWIVDHPGPVITTSTRADNLAVTLLSRTERGPVMVFDPERLAVGVDRGPKWNPARGCDTPKVAIRRAGTLVGDTAGSEDKDGFWKAQTITAVQCLLHAAALSDADALDLYRWSASPAKALEALHVLQLAEGAQEGWADALESVLAGDEKIMAGTWGGVSNTFACLADPDVLEAVSPTGDRFDPAAFLGSDGCCYLLGTAGGPVSRLIAAFIEDVVIVARQIASRRKGARLDPPLGLILDEAANYPLPSLPSLMSEGGGTGITTVCVLQSLAQARDRWGVQAAQAVWDAATVKVVLGGQANADDLDDMSKLCGEREVKKVATSGGGWLQPGTQTVSTQNEPILTPAQLRTMRFGQAMLLLRSAPPIELRMRRWLDRADADTLQASKQQTENLLQEAADAPA